LRHLVVGGAGYIGSVVAAHLVAAGEQVVVADNLSRGHEDAVPAGAELRRVDVLDLPALSALVAEGFDSVLHFAALSLVGESVAEPARYFRTNVGGTINLLDAIRHAGARRLVFSSTAAVYGEPESVPIGETATTRPTNPYGASKLAVDEAIRYEAAASGLGAVSLRYFNVAGASGGQGERHDPETHLIPSVLKVAVGEHDAVRIFGTDYPTPDGTAVRDYIHVDDLARAHLLALERASTRSSTWATAPVSRSARSSMPPASSPAARSRRWSRRAGRGTPRCWWRRASGSERRWAGCRRSRRSRT
jgi:UDP-glucose 4-epimerase